MSAVAHVDPRDGDLAPPRDPDGSTAVRSDTALAFLVAPAVPACLGALVLAMVVLGDGGFWGAFIAFWLSFFALAFGGYLSALVVGVPLYLLVRAWTRSIPLPAAAACGGIVAALPWTVLAIAEREGGRFAFVALMFALGCVGGVAFSLRRDGRPRRAVRTGGGS